MTQIALQGDRAITVLLLFTVIFVAATVIAPTPATARAPSQPVCGVCTQALDQAADDRGVDLKRGTSRMDIQVHTNGTATYTAQVSLHRGAERLQNKTLRNAVVRDVSYILVETRRDLQTHINETTLMVRYRAPVSQQPLGVIAYDGFKTTAPLLAVGGEGEPYPGADTLIMRAPPEQTVHGSYGNSTTETTVVWHGDSHERYAGRIEDNSVITFVPSDTTVPALRVQVAGLLEWLGNDRIEKLSRPGLR